MTPFYFGSGTYFGPHTYFGGPPGKAFVPGPTAVPGPNLLLGVPPEPLGAAFLVDQFGEAGRLVVEAAFGADLTADPDLWEWTDLSHDVRHDDKITCKLGRANEGSASQPASMSCTLDNRSGRYALGPVSPLYPGVRRGTPVRVRVNTGSGGGDGSGVLRVIWQGGADSWSPGWDITGANATVQLSASGVLRRLAQGKADKTSVMRRTLPHLLGTVAYWPVEDLDSATSIAPGLDRHGPAAVTGKPTYAKADAFKSSDKLAYLDKATWVGVVPGYTPTGSLQVRFALQAEDEGTYTGTDATFLKVHLAGGTMAQLWLQYDTGTGGGISLYGRTTAGDTPLASDELTPIQEIPQGVSIDLQQVGSGIAWQLTTFLPGSPVTTSYSGTIAGQTLGRVTRVTVGDGGRSGTLGLLAVGHLTVRTTFGPGADWEPISGFAGEYADSRLARLCGEAGLQLDVRGYSLTRMGPQKTDALLPLLRECEAADQGILFDGLGPGLTYVARVQRESPATGMTVDLAAGQLAKELAPVDDDQGDCNSMTVTRKDGSKVTVTDDDGPMGTGIIGVYDSSATVNIDSDTRIEDYASWAVHLGTAQGYRLPGLQLNLAASPELADAWLTLLPSARIDLANVNARRTQLDDALIGLLLEGYTQTLSQFEWTVKANTSPAEPWRVGYLPFLTGTPQRDELRAQPDGSTVAAGTLPQATALAVTTPSGPLWTTDPADFPMDLDIGGRLVVATACAGSTSPQTFTITPVSWVIPAGASVGLWRSPPPAL